MATEISLRESKERRRNGAAAAGRMTGRRTAKRSEPENPWLNINGSGRNLQIDQFLTFHIIRLANAAKTNVTRRYLEEFNLSVPEWRLLAMSLRFAPVRFSELVSRSSMDKGQVSRTLQALAKRGLISTRAAPGHSGDGIAHPVVVSVTAKGKKLFDTVLPVAQRNQAQLLLVLSQAERKALYSILTKLYKTIGDIEKDEEPEAAPSRRTRAARH